MDKLLDQKWQNAYKIGQEVRVRMVLIHPETKIMQFSLKTHLINDRIIRDWIKLSI